MDLAYVRNLIDHLDARGVLFEPGLSEEETTAIEARYGIAFPPDLRKLLGRALPVSPGFPNWRRAQTASLRHSLEAPIQGLLFDAEQHHIWLDAWGPRPSTRDQALALLRETLATVPPLVPVYGHHYMPTMPHVPGNPIFAVVQTDIIYAGCDLPSYFAAEFGVPCPSWAASTPRPIPFWDALVA